MNIKTKIALVVGGVLLMMACSYDLEETELFNTPTNQKIHRADSVGITIPKRFRRRRFQ